MKPIMWVNIMTLTSLILLSMMTIIHFAPLLKNMSPKKKFLTPKPVYKYNPRQSTWIWQW